MYECVLFIFCNFQLTFFNNEYKTHGLPKTLTYDLFKRLLCARIDMVQGQRKYNCCPRGSQSRMGQHRWRLIINKYDLYPRTGRNSNGNTEEAVTHSKQRSHRQEKQERSTQSRWNILYKNAGIGKVNAVVREQYICVNRAQIFVKLYATYWARLLYIQKCIIEYITGPNSSFFPAPTFSHVTLKSSFL